MRTIFLFHFFYYLRSCNVVLSCSRKEKQCLWLWIVKAFSNLFYWLEEFSSLPYNFPYLCHTINKMFAYHWHINKSLLKHLKGQSDDRIHCVLLAVSTCNCWHNVFFCICSSIKHHFKRLADILMIKTSSHQSTNLPPIQPYQICPPPSPPLIASPIPGPIPSSSYLVSPARWSAAGHCGHSPGSSLDPRYSEPETHVVLRHLVVTILLWCDLWTHTILCHIMLMGMILLWCDL